MKSNYPNYSKLWFEEKNKKAVIVDNDCRFSNSTYSLVTDCGLNRSNASLPFFHAGLVLILICVLLQPNLRHLTFEFSVCQKRKSCAILFYNLLHPYWHLCYP